MSKRKRIFVVGVPRSGTTLVQSILNAHVDVKGYPETHFFRTLFPSNKMCRWLGMTSRSCWRYLNDLQGVLPEASGLSRKSLFRLKQTKLFADSTNKCKRLEAIGCR